MISTRLADTFLKAVLAVRLTFECPLTKIWASGYDRIQENGHYILFEKKQRKMAPMDFGHILSEATRFDPIIPNDKRTPR